MRGVGVRNADDEDLLLESREKAADSVAGRLSCLLGFFISVDSGTPLPVTGSEGWLLLATTSFFGRHDATLGFPSVLLRVAVDGSEDLKFVFA
jgi:hypothetical protein